MKKLLQYTPFLLITCVTVALFIKVNQNGKDAANGLLSDSLMVGKQVADYPLEVIAAGKGEKLTVDSYKGGYTVINFFASWCISCLHEHQYVKQLKGESGLKIVGIAWRDKKQDALDWLKQNGNPYDKVGLDNMGKFGILMGVSGIPETYLLDKNGKIVLHLARTITQSDVDLIREEVKK
jgi:cytochrome c biogenesis protein CcmG, thiol:disulfide interchange protein DsbE